MAFFRSVLCSLRPSTYCHRRPTMPAYNTNGAPRPDRTTRLVSTADSVPMELDSPKAHIIPKLLGNFELVTEEELEFSDIKIAKWRSKESGLRVVWADVEGAPAQLSRGA